MTVPSKMKAVVTCGEPGKVEVRDVEVPEPQLNEVLVQVEAAAANPTDRRFRVIS
jgi:NADPH:quinone reductase-like Zn-dependent oxidoreductase